MVKRIRFWQQTDGTFSPAAPLTSDERDRTPVYARTNQGQWHYSFTSQAKLDLVKESELPKEIHLQLILLGEE